MLKAIVQAMSGRCLCYLVSVLISNWLGYIHLRTASSDVGIVYAAGRSATLYGAGGLTAFAAILPAQAVSLGTGTRLLVGLPNSLVHYNVDELLTDPAPSVHDKPSCMTSPHAAGGGTCSDTCLGEGCQPGSPCVEADEGLVIIEACFSE